MNPNSNPKPVINQIFIQPDEMPTELKGLYIPDSARKPNFQGVVTKVGKGSYNNPMKINVGDRVLYESATTISESLVVTSQHNVFGKFIK